MSLLSWFYAPGEQQRSDDLDAQRIALEERRAQMGLITPQQAQSNIANIQGERVNVGAQLDDAFVEGAKEGYDATTGAIKSTIAAPFKFTWDIIPWQLMLAGVVALFFYLGGATMLKGILIKK